ncbi:MAG: TVP38/TMEM64 family protein [Deltaproteobacteria bacterium]
MQPRLWIRAALAVGLLAALAASTAILTVPAWRMTFNTRLTGFLEAVRGLGSWGPVAVGLAFIPACLFFLPGSPLTLFGGFAFGGTFRGLAAVTVCVSVGSTLGASAAFLVGRSVARAWIERKVAAHPRFRAIDAAVAEQGFKIVLLARLSPVFPFNLLNYAFGLTRVSFRDYALASWLGMLPGTILYVYIGSTVGALADVVAGKVEKSPAQQVLFYAGLAATLAVTLYITRIAKRALAEAVPGERDGAPREETR